MIDINEMFNKMLDNDITIKSINANIIYNSKLNTIFNTYKTDKGFAEAVVAAKLAPLEMTQKTFYNPFVTKNPPSSWVPGFSNNQNWIPRIELHRTLERDFRLEEIKIAIANYITSYITKQPLDYTTFIDYVTIGVLVDKFFQSNRQKDTIFARLKKYIQDNWYNIEKLEIGRYINLHQLLFHVVLANNTDVLEHILRFDFVDVCVTDDNGNPLLKYCKDVELIKILLNKCHSVEKREEFVNMCDSHNKPVLHHFAYAAENKDFTINNQIISLLIRNGASVNMDDNGTISQTKIQKTKNALIQKIIKLGDDNLTKFVLNNPLTNVNIKDVISGKNLLHTAVDINSAEITEIIATNISRNLIDDTDDNGETALLSAVKNNANSEIVKILLEHGANPNFEDKNGKTALFFIKDAESLQHLIDNSKTDFWHKDIVDKNFLYYLVDDKKIIQKITNFLNANPDKKHACFLVNKYNENPFHWVASIGVCKLYINLLGDDCKEYIQQKNIRGDTPLHWARNAQIATLLIEHGADVNARNDAQATPLHWADNVDIAKVLIENAAIIDAIDDIGNTPIIYAERHDNKDVQNFLENYMIDVKPNKRLSFFHKLFK